MRRLLASLIVAGIGSICVAAMASEAGAEYREPGNLAEAKALLQKMEGVYKNRFDNELVNGDQFQSENIMEFVPVSDRAAYVRIHTEWYNAHICEVAEMAEYRRFGGFVLRLPYDEKGDDGTPCFLTIMLNGSDIEFDVPTSGCTNPGCGARGGWRGSFFTMGNKRAIRYLPVILRSTEYKEALKNYRETSPEGSTVLAAAACPVYNDKKKLGHCFWMEDKPPYCWVPAPIAAADKDACRQLDSCSPGGGMVSGGGCYKWAPSSDVPPQ